MNNYILNGKIPIKCDNIILWAKWFEKVNRHVAETKKNNITVSTIFLGMDHSFNSGEPLLFETMIFGGEHDEKQWRYSTWEDAEIGHKQACELAGI